MNYKDIQALAISMSTEDCNIISTRRDLYFDPIRKMFMHQPVTKVFKEHALTIIDGKNKGTYRLRRCEFVGRYDINVNPSWLIEDMMSVQ